MAVSTDLELGESEPTSGDYTSLANVKDYLRIQGGTEDAFLTRLIASASASFTALIRRDLLTATYTQTEDWNLMTEWPPHSKPGIKGVGLWETPVQSVQAVTIDGQPIPAQACPSWKAGTLYYPNQVVKVGLIYWGNADTNVNGTTSGTTAPSGTGNGVSDGGCTWNYLMGSLNPPPIGPSVLVPGWRIQNDRLELVGWWYFLQYIGLVMNYYVGVRQIAITYTAGYDEIPPDVEQAVIEMVADAYKRRDRLGQRSRSMGGESVTYFVDTTLPSVKAVADKYERWNAPL